ncbi:MULTISPECIES: MarR family winged helix-turn-helix transcriptional regulator [unclassified Arthrobacter]|uniref:MarR family winged helix-turn-helix transcriptional regulator n=1 Tax=unclassified Arthrobacter TaxID=235627 RepID=UPI001D1331B8|nr:MULTISPECIES: MarR family transcriptional regulator [unclassified Arthrobacter]MCC3291284.1 MarR family transcriptional regulator [Arthrobacter sp. zg-Y1110]MCC3301331.1 MarR family transcriptional regulator [Arthrobacter sp. zg-Y895]MCQ1947111.1 MarR family transcriptional regulator [Arthrobacter sp. zg-Y1116]MCQ1986737.1 MarR family transcriptional regulator [Arthrobacter sp. zg-Y844]UWX83709.1 MarR family transcriptional regulator [Arthrobacter sp. zg-Y1110]
MNESLQRQVCFSLYSASRAATALYRPMLEEMGLTYPQYLVMSLLWEKDAQSVRDLGEALDLDSGTLSPLLKRLEAADLVQRRRAVEDERRVRIHLTDAGRALEHDARNLPDRLAASAGLAPQDLESLQDTLAKVTAALRQAVAK